jgi:hypothetical protein
MRFSGIILGLLGFVAAVATAQDSNPPVLSAEELTQLDRESAMWRAVRADLDVPDNIAALRNLGYADSDLAWFRPKLAQVWQLPGAKGLGMLSADVRERIAEVEKEFVRFYRDTRRFQETGVRPANGLLYSASELNTRWRRAMIQALSYEEMQDYGLARSDEAKRVERLTRGLTLTTIEQRELIKMARDFGDRDTGFAPPRPNPLPFYEAQLDYYAAIRDLMGAGQFVTYLERANEDFLALRQTLGEKAPPAAALDLFWLRQNTAIAVRRNAPPQKERQSIGDRAREEAAKILGATLAAEYATSENGRWLYPR